MVWTGLFCEKSIGVKLELTQPIFQSYTFETSWSTSLSQFISWRISVFPKCILLFNFLPINNFPPILDIIESFILVVQIVGVFPYVNHKDRVASKCKRAILIGCADDLQFSTFWSIPHKPNITCEYITLHRVTNICCNKSQTDANFGSIYTKRQRQPRVNPAMALAT